MNLKNTKAVPETKTLTHQGHSTSRLSMDSSLRAMKSPCWMNHDAVLLALCFRHRASFLMDDIQASFLFS